MNEEEILNIYENVPALQGIGPKEEFLEAMADPENRKRIYDNVPELQEVGTAEEFVSIGTDPEIKGQQGIDPEGDAFFESLSQEDQDKHTWSQTETAKDEGFFLGTYDKEKAKREIDDLRSDWDKQNMPDVDVDEDGEEYFLDSPLKYIDWVDDTARAFSNGLLDAHVVDKAGNLFADGKNITNEDLTSYMKAVKAQANAKQSNEYKKFQKVVEDNGGGFMATVKGLWAGGIQIPLNLF
jgi:hypothetical protein